MEALAPYRRQFWILHRNVLPSLLVYEDDVIDHDESEVMHSPADTLIVNYKFLTNYPVKEKGTFVDVWI